LPLLLFCIGCLCFAISYTDIFFIADNYAGFFKGFEKLGSVFVSLAFISLLYKLIIGFMRFYERKLAELHKITALILRHLRKGLRVIFILIALDFAITILSPKKLYLTLANNTIDTFLIVAIGWIAIQLFYTIEAVLYQYISDLPATEHHRGKALYTKMHIFRNVATVLVVLITLAAILMSFSSVRNIGISLLASAGFLTAIIGLSAQKTLFSLFAGVQIAFSQIIKIGDLVLINNESGLIEEITFTFVTIKLGDRRRLIVPISQFIEKPFENWSRDHEGIRSSLLLYVDYRMPIEPLREELHRILDLSPFWDKNARKLQVMNLKERAVELRIQVSAKNAEDLSDLKTDVREKMLAFIRQTYPQYLPRIKPYDESEDGHDTILAPQ
jgi:small-conductance mechanosensitive channel